MYHEKRQLLYSVLSFLKLAVYSPAFPLSIEQVQLRIQD